MNKRVKILLALAIILIAMLVLSFKISYAADALISPAPETEVTDESTLPAKLRSDKDGLSPEEKAKARQEYEEYVEETENVSEVNSTGLTEEELKEKAEQRKVEQQEAAVEAERQSAPGMATAIVLLFLIFIAIIAIFVKLGVISTKSNNVK